MRVVTRIVVTVLCAVALVTFAGALSGCGQSAEKGASGWERVVSAEVSGEQPVKLNLGTHRLGNLVRLAWELSGPESPPVKITFRIFSIKNGLGVGRTVSPETDPDIFKKTDDAITLGPFWPGEYRMFLSQRFVTARGPGYDIKLTVFTMEASPAP